VTYSAFETSVEGSRPIELYRFVVGSDTYEYTSATDEVTVGGLTYKPRAIKRSRIGQGPEDRKSLLEVELPAADILPSRYMAVVPGRTAELTLQRVQRSDFPGPEVVTLFKGKVQSVGFSSNGKLAKIAVAPEVAATARSIPKFGFQSLCNHFVYDDRCQVDDTDPAYRLSNAAVASVTSATITVPGALAFPNGWFTGGFVEALGGDDSRLILAHDGDELTLLLPFPFNVDGQLVTLLAGCAHDLATCDSKFSNVINFGGFAFVPWKNPFETGVK
jgi:uncharacterized phage protein (TIGR02218 family)